MVKVPSQKQLSNLAKELNKKAVIEVRDQKPDQLEPGQFVVVPIQ